MLIPRFTLRWMLLATTICGLFFFLVSLALGGQAWALALVMAVGSILLAMIAYACAFFVTWLLSTAVQLRRRPRAGSSPFATSAPPPQIIPPVDPE